MSQPTDSRELRAIYLRDHHAAAAAGVELARRLARRNAGQPYGPELAQLSQEIESDRATLSNLLHALGVHPSTVKIAFARLAERMSRLKPNGRLTSYSPLSRLIELETLYVGITGKRALWLALEAANNPESALQAFDFQQLADSATTQSERVERLRLEAAAGALA